MPASDPRRRLPALERLLVLPEVVRLLSLYGRERVAIQLRDALAGLRERLAGGELAGPGELEAAVAALPGAAATALAAELGAPLRRVLNASGVLLHTNLGRAPLPRSVAAALPGLLDAGCDLELDLASGRRGDRNARAGALLAALTGAEAGLVVNNNAAALVLVLATFAAGREVIVSRGELVEIGGSFRIPEILAAAGTRLVEVGTTNRTRLADYERALTSETALLLKVHTSNYRITGFVEEAGAAALAGLARSRGLLLLVDEGSGLLRPHRAPQLADHPSFTALLAAGADLVCGSGDKLLGGPQAGLLCGRAELVARCHRHPLYRALRPDRTVFAALDGVLRAHLAGDGLPLDRLWPEPAAHRRRLERLAARLGAAIVPGDAYVGGGAAPERPIPGEILALPGGERLAARLRTGEPPAVGYAREGRCLLDLRTLDPADDELLAAAVERARAGLDEG
ncbi:MAG: L-seryl-tRNA(Sec) selenium transferase [Acidobacteria bacterium]|nr:L-seryl-tRNA(Sec) selenium transferase [Thermoanaerobaculia bacterium]NLN10036.1 L-seryl-tRNA(Sec) selenium transferase [Acidobacteriota bacterium]MBP7813911.1 L-seryl-tRNA(Sec) selenium transferase [Thermoanaerobaculia bacterium]HPA95898.1 L-seryl-tRNA(Sec) selenium transferase [Thermoanaerobaculia bacterium]HRR14698.1 L-seryl-tRNA(Sec) selenium transferase [Thermoanaerobaculia bacterium]